MSIPSPMADKKSAVVRLPGFITAFESALDTARHDPDTVVRRVLGRRETSAEPQQGPAKRL